MARTEIGIAVLVVVLVALAIVGGVHSADEWRDFKAKHNCVIVGKMDGDVFNTFGVSGNGQIAVGIGSTPSKTGWKCDDGVTYWK